MTRVAPIVAVFLFASCGGQEIPLIETEERFRIGIGTLEDEIDLFLRDGKASARETRFLLNEGLFFIANGPRSKILEFTSHGDLLQMLYHPDLNPAPVMLQEIGGDGTVVNRWAVPFAFHSVGRIAVTPTRDLYVEEQLPPERFVQTEDGTLNRFVVLRFDRRGNYLDYIGRDGVAGSPFAFIDQVLTNDRSDLIVISRTASALEYFFFNREGDLEHSGFMELASLPVPEAFRVRQVIPVLETVWSDWSQDWLYFHITYLEEVRDEESGGQVGITFHGSRVFPFDVVTQRFQVGFPVPTVRAIVDDNEGEHELDRPVEFLGATRGRDFAFLSMEQFGRFRLIFTDMGGDVIEQRSLDFPLEEKSFVRFSLASNGTLGALVSDGSVVRAVWWRTDRILGLFDATPGF